MKINLVFAKLLRIMYEGNHVNRGSFAGGNRKLLEQFIKDHVLEELLIGSSQKKIFCSDSANLERYLHHKFEIASLDHFIAFLEKENTQRSDAVKATSNSKYKSNTKVFTGFLINAYQPIRCFLNDEPFVVQPMKGVFTFIVDYKNLKIPEHITIVGVEGHENFREIERQRDLFKDIEPLFVWRYQNSNAIADWLKMIPNNYLHFGDYDPKGLHIYIAEFRNKIGIERCRFFFPDDLEFLMSNHGEKELFEKQISYLSQLRLDTDSDLLTVLGIIEKLKKGLAQEALIR